MSMQPGNPIVGGVSLRRPAISSPNYVKGSIGWTINADGSAEFNNVTIRGTVIAGNPPTGNRVEIDGANGTIFVYNASNVQVIAIDSLSESLTITDGTNIFRVSASGGIAIDLIGNVVINGQLNLGGSPLTDPISILGAVSSGEALSTVVSGDSTARYAFDVSGTQTWGDGAGTVDIQLDRQSAGVLHLAGNLHVDQGDVTSRGNVLQSRVATTVNTSNTGAFSAETITDSVTANLLTGFRYSVEYYAIIEKSVAGSDTVLMRQDNITGTGIAGARVYCPDAGGGFGAYLYGEYTAVASAAKTFVVTNQVTTGGGTTLRRGSATNPSFLKVNRIG